MYLVLRLTNKSEHEEARPYCIDHWILKKTFCTSNTHVGHLQDESILLTRMTGRTCKHVAVAAEATDATKKVHKWPAIRPVPVDLWYTVLLQYTLCFVTGIAKCEKFRPSETDDRYVDECLAGLHPLDPVAGRLADVLNAELHTSKS